MDIKYEDYLDRGTRRIMELFSSAGISTEERDAIVSAFTDELVQWTQNITVVSLYEPQDKESDLIPTSSLTAF